SLGLERVEYEPEQFPGLIYRSDSVSGVVLIFASGKAVITGLSSREKLNQTAKKVRREFREISK
ncbi:transcription factor, partial [Halobacterium salinarum]|nr:transcription factor [Halobacterium salinarum]